MFEHKHLLNPARAARRGENLASPFMSLIMELLEAIPELGCRTFH